MKVTLQLEDDLYEKYQNIAGTADQEEVEAHLRDTLTTVADLDLSAGLYVTPEQKRELEKLLAVNLTDAASLLRRLEVLTSVKLEGVNLELTLGQKAEIARRAHRQGKTYEEGLQEIFRLMTPLFFHGLEG